MPQPCRIIRRHSRCAQRRIRSPPVAASRSGDQMVRAAAPPAQLHLLWRLRTAPSRRARSLEQAMEAPTAPATKPLWGHEHLPLLARARSKDSVEYILQALWRTRRTGLDAADRAVVRDILQIPTDSELDPLLVCLRILIRRCVHENVAKDDIAKLFPGEVLPELQRLLTLLLQKFQPEWREDTLKDQASAPISGTTSTNQDVSEKPAITELHCGTSSAKEASESAEKDGNLRLAKDTLDKMLKDIYPIMGQMSNAGNSNGHGEAAKNT